MFKRYFAACGIVHGIENDINASVQLLRPNPVTLCLAPFTPMQQWWHLPNLRSPNSTRLTESWFLPWNGVGGSAGAGPGWRRQEKFPINLWMTPNINLSCARGFHHFSLYTQSYRYPQHEQANPQILVPLLIGFIGRYCLKGFFPFPFTICSSTQTFWPIWYACLNFSLRTLIIGRNFYS